MPLVTTTTSITRPALNTSDRGTLLFETDTNRLVVWTGGQWVLFTPDSRIDPLFINNRSAFVYYDRSQSSENDSATLRMNPGSPLFASDVHEFGFSIWVCSYADINYASTSTQGLGPIMAGGNSGGANRAYVGISGKDRIQIKITDAQGSYYTRQTARGDDNQPTGYDNIADGQFQSPVHLNDGKWHHIVVSGKYVAFDSEIEDFVEGNRIFRAWVDGEACALYNNPGVYQGVDYKHRAVNTSMVNIWANAPWSTNPLEIGTYGSTTGMDGFSGWVDELALFKKYLTNEEVAAIYSGGTVADLTQPLPNYEPTKLFHYFRMGDDDGSLREDKEVITTTFDSVELDQTTGAGGQRLNGLKIFSGYTHAHLTPILTNGPIFTSFTLAADGSTTTPFPDAKAEYDYL